MTLLARRACWRTRFCAFLAVVTCGLALGVPSAALGAGPRCSSLDLRLGVHSSHTTAAGRMSWVLVLHNEREPCYLHGYPATDLLDHNGGLIHGLKAHVRHALGAVHTVNLLHRGMAYFTFSVTDGATCHHHFHVYRVGFLLSRHLELMLGRTSICDHSAEVSAFRAHA